MGGYLVGQGKTTKTRTRAPGLDGVRALAVLAVEPTASGANQWTWTLQDIPGIHEESHMPPWRGLATRSAAIGNAIYREDVR